MAQLLLGRPLADAVLEELKTAIVAKSLRPGLAVVLVGHDPASEIYVRLKQQAAERIGIAFGLVRLPENAPFEELQSVLTGLNADPSVHGIIVQFPLPSSLNEDAVIRLITPEKDADGFHPENLKAYLAGKPSPQPVFPRAILSLLESAGAPSSGRSAVAVVNSDLFGQVLVETLKRAGWRADYLVRHCLADSLDRVRAAQAVITACGKPGLITADMLSPGAVVIDGGVTRLPDGRVVGDVERETVSETVAAIAPVPGGAGPLTIAYLLDNVVTAALKNKNGSH